MAISAGAATAPKSTSSVRRGANVLWRVGADADRIARARLEVDLHLAADDPEQDGHARAQRQIRLTDTWSLQSNIYVRRFQQVHVDGNDAEFERCSGNAAIRCSNTLCLEDDGFPRPVPLPAQ